MESKMSFNTKIFADGADKESMLELYDDQIIEGFTTNPTLMKAAGILNYEEFCIDILETINDKPISFEVFSDDFDEMERQALKISSWGSNVFVKIPITNSQGASSREIIYKLVSKGVKVNVTALFTLEQVKTVASVLDPKIPSYVSVFAGRIADTGRDPMPTMVESLKVLQPLPQAQLIWASPRELLNLVQASDIGCHVITATPDIIKKLKFIDYDLESYSLDTVNMFYSDSLSAGYTL